MTNAGQRIIAIANPELGRLQDCEMIVFKMPSSVEGVGINEFGMDTSSEWIRVRNGYQDELIDVSFRQTSSSTFADRVLQLLPNIASSERGD
jgi:hypothetical protein